LKNRDGEVDKSRHRKNSLKATGLRKEKIKIGTANYNGDIKKN